MLARPSLLVSLAFAVACSSSAASPGSGAAASDAGAAPLPEAAPGSSTVHGKMVDYQSLSPVAGLAVTSGDQSTTTAADGTWSLSVPTGSTVQAAVTSDTYSRLLFPDMVARDGDVDLSTVVIPDSSTFTLAKDVLKGFDETKALVWLVLLTRPSCASAAGGTVSVASPSGASVAYFGTAALPSASVTTFQAVANARPVAALYNVDPAGTLAVTIDHPSCTMAAFPADIDGRTYLGTVRLQPAADGHNSAIVAVLE